MRVRKRSRKTCVVCGNSHFPPVYAIQYFHHGKGRFGNRTERQTPKSIQVQTKGFVCYRCLHEYFPGAIITRGYRATKAKILELLANADDKQLQRAIVFYEPLWYTAPEFWDI